MLAINIVSFKYLYTAGCDVSFSSQNTVSLVLTKPILLLLLLLLLLPLLLLLIIIIITIRTFMNKKTKDAFLVDIAVPNTHNLAKTITDKQNKYQKLANEICAVWKRKAAQVIPIVILSTAVIPKSLSQSLTTLNLHTNTYIQLQKCVILGTCSIVRNFLNYK